jgi:tetratricopeptide (TPR) repeat protein
MSRSPLLWTTVVLMSLTTLASHAQDDAEALIQRGTALHDEGKFAEAIDQFKAAVKLDPRSMSAHYEMANTYFAMQEFDRCIAEADIVIDSKVRLAQQAYDVKGSALDVAGRTKEAIRSYEKGVKEFPEYQLLHFNLGLTLFKDNQFKQAEKQLQASLRLNNNHPGSLLVLGYCMQQQGGRARALLCFYNFLLLEQDGKRARAAYDALKGLLTQGVERTDEGNINVSLAMGGKEEDEFRAAEMMVSMQQAAHVGGSDSARTEMEHFTEQTRGFFNVLGELKDNDKKNTGFWWDFHVRFFHDLAKSGHLDTFCNLVSSAGDEAEAKAWIEGHADKVTALFAWCAEQDRSF